MANSANIVYEADHFKIVAIEQDPVYYDIYTYTDQHANNGWKICGNIQLYVNFDESSDEWKLWIDENYALHLQEIIHIAEFMVTLEEDNG